MAFRKHRAGEIVIEQTRDYATIRRLLEQDAMITDGIEWPPACYLLAFDGDEAVGTIGVEPLLDAALLRSVYVVPSYRRRGLARDLVAQARKAAHTRGARELYLFSTGAGEFFMRLGFEPVAVSDVTAALKGTPQADYYLARPDELARETAYRMDISRDGIIER